MKAVLVLPEMPKDCMECRLCFNGKDNMYCLAFVPERLILYRSDIDYKPMYCPLRPLPERVTATDGVDCGWNACISAIEGSGEDD
ncbi:MAG: hypothetical protein LUD12_13280 [Lachnospiraceae bacterium]|nr:hypothetical protein [Lachnospiraceae bacterium]